VFSLQTFIILPRKIANPGATKKTARSRLISCRLQLIVFRVSFLSSVLSDAVEEDYVISINPAIFSSGNKKKKKEYRASKMDLIQKINPMSRLQVDSFEAEAQAEPMYGMFYLFLIKTGLQPGEARALRVGDLDFQNKVVQVEKALTKDGRVKPTKTEESRRVDLGSDLIDKLYKHLVYTKSEGLRFGTGTPEWLFFNKAGMPLDPTRIRSVFQRILKKAKLPDFRVYDCRHTYASLLLSYRAPLTYVSQQLGHRNSTTTLRYYARWVWDGQSKFADLLNFRAKTPVALRAGMQPAKLGTKSWHHKGLEWRVGTQVIDFVWWS
jgi:integrase